MALETLSLECQLLCASAATYAINSAHLPKLGKFCKGMQNWDYSAIGTLQLIDWNQKHIATASSELHIERLIRLAGAIAEGKFAEITGAHSASYGGGYTGGICSSSCAGE